MSVGIEWRGEAPERTKEMEAEAARLASELGRLGAHMVVLFGSRARRDARAGSDIDLLVVMPCDPSWTFARRLAEVGAMVDPRFATDILVYTPEEFEGLRHANAFVRQAMSEGRILFDRDVPPSAGVEGR